MTFERRDYFGSRFSEDELRQILALIGVSPRESLSRRSRVYQSRSDELDALSDDELIRQIVAEPTLLRRPIIVGDQKHMIGAKKTDLEQFVQTVV